MYAYQLSGYVSVYKWNPGVVPIFSNDGTAYLLKSYNGIYKDRYTFEHIQFYNPKLWASFCLICQTTQIIATVSYASFGRISYSSLLIHQKQVLI